MRVGLTPVAVLRPMFESTDGHKAVIAKKGSARQKAYYQRPILHLAKMQKGREVNKLISKEIGNYLNHTILGELLMDGSPRLCRRRTTLHTHTRDSP